LSDWLTSFAAGWSIRGGLEHSRRARVLDTPAETFTQ
jgi:hypothetical protein